MQRLWSFERMYSFIDSNNWQHLFILCKISRLHLFLLNAIPYINLILDLSCRQDTRPVEFLRNWFFETVIGYAKIEILFKLHCKYVQYILGHNIQLPVLCFNKIRVVYVEDSFIFTILFPFANVRGCLSIKLYSTVTHFFRPLAILFILCLVL